MADLDMSKLPKVEESGDRCIRRIQEFIINELSSDQAAVLPEDKLQRLIVGVSSYIFRLNSSLTLQTRVCKFLASNSLRTRVLFRV